MNLATFVFILTVQRNQHRHSQFKLIALLLKAIQLEDHILVQYETFSHSFYFDYLKENTEVDHSNLTV